MAGTFYYYVVATNTVTLEDGVTDIASTTSNVATVTVKEAELVTPGESSEPEDGQEPPESDELSGEELGSNDLNDGESLPPEDDGTPVTPNNSDSESEGDGKTRITEMTLQNFKSYGGSTAENVDLLNQSEPLSWAATGSGIACTINFTVELEDGAEDKSLQITLPYGMQFVGLVEDDGQVTNISGPTIESVEWKHSKPVYGNSSNSDYQRNNGTLVINFPDKGATSSSFAINVQPDAAFLPTDQRESGYLIEGAIQATVQVGEEAQQQVSVV